MKEKCVSIIVPVYNSAQYIEKSIESILNQTYSNLQILLIDDGSTDSSGAMCDEYAKKDTRIEVYHIKNSGVSEARNYGLKYVKGEYIQFVDSDDVLKSEMTERLVTCLEEKQTDMVVCNYIKIFNSLELKNESLERPRIYTNAQYLKNTLRDPGHHYYGVVWNKLYRTCIVKNNNLEFKREVNLGEDFIFNLEYIVKSYKIAVIRDYLYLYNKCQNNTLSNNLNKKIGDCQWELENRKQIFRYYIKAFKRLRIFEKYKTRIYFYWVIFYVRQHQDLKYAYKDWSLNDKKDWLEQINSDKHILKSMKIVSKVRIILYKNKYYFEYMLKYILKRLLKFK